MKKILALVLMMALMIPCAALAADPNGTAEITFSYGDVNPFGHVIVNAAEYFRDQLYEKTNGRIWMEIYPSGQLGDDAECYQGMQMGAVDMYRGNASSLTDFGKNQISALALPYIFRDRNHFWDVCTSELGDSILANLQECGTGMVALCFLDEGARNFFTTTKPVTKLADLAGQKIRVQQSALMMDTVAALGASPTPVDYAELYTALQSGIVDGAENPLSGIDGNALYEVSEYLTLDNHTYNIPVLVMSERTWNKANDATKALLKETWMECVNEFFIPQLETYEAGLLEKFAASGVTIVESLPDYDKWVEACAPVWAKYGAGMEELIAKAQSYLE